MDEAVLIRLGERERLVKGSLELCANPVPVGRGRQSWLLVRAVRALEAEPAAMAAVLAGQRRRHGWDDTRLAAWLGMAAELYPSTVPSGARVASWSPPKPKCSATSQPSASTRNTSVTCLAMGSYEIMRCILRARLSRTRVSSPESRARSAT